MTPTVRHNPDLDATLGDAFDPQPPVRETKPVTPSALPSANGHTHRLSEHLSRPDRLDALDQLAEMPPEELDELIGKTRRRLSLLVALRGDGPAEAPAGPKVDAPGPAGDRPPRERVLLSLLTHGRLTSSQLATKAGIHLKGLGHGIDRTLVTKKGGRLGRWELLPEGRRVAEEIRGRE